MNLTHTTRWLAATALFAALAVAAPESAEEKKLPANPGSPSGASAQKPAQPAGKERRTVYVPPPRGAVGARTGGGTRGQVSAPRIAVLAPDHIGLTTRSQPALVWYLSADTTAPVELTVIADGAVEPLVVKRLPSPQRAGINVVALSTLDVQLAEGTTYDWYVALVLDSNARDSDVVAGGAIQRSAATPDLAKELASGEPSYRVLARNGIWYDSIADLSAAIAAAPPSSPAGRDLRAERALLLEQVGVAAAAAYDRGPRPQ